MKIKDTIFFDEDEDVYGFTAKIADLKTSKISYETKTGYKNRREAAAAADEYQKKYDTVMKTLRKVQQTKVYMFRDYLNDWKKAFRKTADGGYANTCDWTFDSIIFPSMESDMPLKSVTADYINALIRRCSPLCDSAGPMSYKFLALSLRDAYLDGLIKDNILDYVEKIRFEKPDIVYCSADEIRILLKEAEKSSCYLEILLAFLAGLRTGEILGLKEADVDVKAKTISIHRQVVRNFDKKDPDDENNVVKPPKTKSSYRTIGVPDVLIREIEKRMEYNKRLPVHENWKGFLCLGEGGSVKGYSTIRACLARIEAKNGLPKINPHALRHLTATVMIEASDMSLNEIADYLGHASVMTTYETYVGVMNGFENMRCYIQESVDLVRTASDEQRCQP